MSVKAMTWAWEQDLKPGPKFVLVALADHSDGQGICWPGHELIAEKCGLSRQTVLEHVAMLERDGYVISEHSRDGRGRHAKARYFLQLGRLSTQPSGLASATPTPVVTMSGNPTRLHVGISGSTMSGFPVPIKDEPKAIEPTTPTPPCLFDVGKADVERWFERVFWPRYPKHVRKSKALSELLAQRPDQVTLDAIAEGLEHRLKAEAAARNRNAWFRAWPDPHRWLKAGDRCWEDRFDVPRETARDESTCFRCSRAAVAVTSGKPHCTAHNPIFERGANA